MDAFFHFLLTATERSLKLSALFLRECADITQTANHFFSKTMTNPKNLYFCRFYLRKRYEEKILDFIFGMRLSDDRLLPEQQEKKHPRGGHRVVFEGILHR